MDDEEDLSCIIIEDDTSENLLTLPPKSFDNENLDRVGYSSPNLDAGIFYGGYDDPNQTFNYLDGLQTDYYIPDPVQNLNPPSPNFNDIGIVKELELDPKSSLTVLTTPSPKVPLISPRAANFPESSIVDLTTPTKAFKPSAGLKRSKNILDEIKSSAKRKKSQSRDKPICSILEGSAELNLSLNDLELANYFSKTDNSPECILEIGSQGLDSSEEVVLAEETVSPPRSNNLPKALSLDTLLSKWNPNFEVDSEKPVEQELSPKSQARLDKRIKKQELQLERAALRQKEREIANVNKKAVDGWQDLTLLFDSQWPMDTKVGQALIALCEQDGAKVVEDSRMTIPFSLCWELKTTKRFDEARAMFVPLPRPVHLPVRKILVKWDASELLEWCLAKKGLLFDETLDAAKFDLQIVKLSYPNYQAIAIVMGTQALFRSIRMHVNRGFNSQVRALDGNPASVNKAPRGCLRGQHELSHIECFEDFLIQMQLLHDLHIVQLETHSEVIDFIHAMTKEISAIPNRPQEMFVNLPELSTRKSDSSEETWRLILEQIYLVTPTVASAVAQEYPSFAALISALRECETEQQRLSLLSEIQVSPPTGRSRRLGDNLASRILKAFTSSDPNLPLS